MGGPEGTLEALLPALVVARALEDGRLRGPLARGLSQVWGRVASRAIVRSLPRPGGVSLVTIGGATLGDRKDTPGHRVRT